MAKTKKQSPWDIAKPFLERDILEGKVTSIMFPRQVKALRQEYQAVGDGFGQNYRNLQKKIVGLKNRASADNQALQHDRIIFPVSSSQWDGSSAQRFLKFDISIGAHKGKTPTQFWSTTSEYQKFDLGIFCPHIY